MKKTHGIGGLTALAGLTATVALLTGIPVANADELEDLRANQELLQRRIDQLAQLPPTKAFPGTPGAMGTQPAPGAALLGGSFPRSFLIPGTDTSIRVGGFVDITGLYFLQGSNNGNPGTPSSNAGQNGNLPATPIGPQVVPGLGPVPAQANHSRGNGVFTFSPQQTRLNFQTRTATGWGEARTFIEFDFAGCNNFSCQTVQHAGGDALLPRLRYGYGTLGNFLAGQALSNFSDGDADNESMEFGNVPGSTGGQRIPQVRYTLVGPWGSAWSMAAEQPFTDMLTPAGIISSDSNVGAPPGGPGTGNIPAICNGVPCTGAGTPISGSIGRTIAPSLTFASYWAQPWGHMDFAGLIRPLDVNDGRFISRKFIGYGGHVSGDVHPGWFGWQKDDFLFSFVAGEAIGSYSSGGWNAAVPLATNFTLPTNCATPIPGCAGGRAASNVLFKTVFSYSASGGYQHWWLPNLRTNIAVGMSHQDVPSQVIGPTQDAAANKEVWATYVNLVWNPVAFITTGVQYMYGKRFTIANGKGQEQVIVGKFRVAF
jgi:hypothetical protein